MTLTPLPPKEVDLLRAMIGVRVARARREAGLSQRALAKVMDRSASWVREIESGSQFAPAYLIAALGRATGHGAGWFYGENQIPDGVTDTLNKVLSLIEAQK